jgi:peptidoglycan/xylan/chitin deacetylase (PgdA/CDA1 family)
MAIEMPRGARCAVCFSFDFDGLSLWFGTFGKFTSQAIGRGEYSARVAVERVLALLQRYGMATTWFVPGHSAETWPAVTRAIVEAGHEIGHHGYCHESPLEMTREQEERILVRGIEAIESVTGRRPVGYRSPIWDTSDNTAALLLEHGFRYMANGMAEDYKPYRVRIGDVPSLTERFHYGREIDLLEIPSAWHLSDMIQLEIVYEFPHRVAVSPSEVERIWFAEFDYMYERVGGGVLTYTFHPEGIGRGHRIVILERLLDHIAQKGDVWMPTMRSVAENWRPDPPGLWSMR